MGRSCYLIFLFAFVCASCFSAISKNGWNNGDKYANIALKDSLEWADYYYNIGEFNKAISIYQKQLNLKDSENTYILKKLSLCSAAMQNPTSATGYLLDYLQLDFKPTFLLNEGFESIHGSAEFENVYAKVLPKVTTWSLLFLFVAVIGFYVVFVVTINKQIHTQSRLLIASFIFIHSLFILNISVNRANYMFEYPHTYLMSTWASFLYGPLLYFYFKATSQKYKFKKIDILHALPTLALLGYMMLSVYAVSSEDKVHLMLSRIQNGLNPQDSGKLLLLVILKIASLTIYGYFIRKIYLKSAQEKLLDAKKLIWQKNVYQIHILYVITYTAYGILVINQVNSGFLYTSSTAAMALMVLYVGYSANIQPDVFSGAYAYKNRLFPKYEKSGLTQSLSNELKENLVYLFAVDKIYKENNINLDMVAQKLNTTRHNASQIINEHFNISFHEFVNMYRIQEAKELLLEDKSRKLSIINVAYEVGYNNKVTFNKAFKKDTQLTPSEYQKNVLRV
ncbi:AraC family transcriptional regulator [Flagellimonas sp. S3867]|uniref:helix-turn-helix domain-containing protein n=1 Tax=Flagellimonas sp. S3867 TaxID=2768063 RepID=UPI0016877AF3|nr:helix-turn-helix domain-containing protein [Flagellimonas sp. S3867]